MEYAGIVIYFLVVDALIFISPLVVGIIGWVIVADFWRILYGAFFSIVFLSILKTTWGLAVLVSFIYDHVGSIVFLSSLIILFSPTPITIKRKTSNKYGFQAKKYAYEKRQAANQQPAHKRTKRRNR
ncbi:MAG: hypothetical protein WCX65_02695 [bacterium]